MAMASVSCASALMRAEAHRAGDEAPDDGLERLHLVQGTGCFPGTRSSSPRRVPPPRVSSSAAALNFRNASQSALCTAAWSSATVVRVPPVLLALAAPLVQPADGQRRRSAAAPKPRAWRSLGLALQLGEARRRRGATACR